jgi:hypothetical protein
MNIEAGAATAALLDAKDFFEQNPGVHGVDRHNGQIVSMRDTAGREMKRPEGGTERGGDDCQG